MSKLRVLSGSDVLRILRTFSFLEIGRKGSHVKVRRITTVGEKQTLTIPDHSELDRGTLRAIYRQTLRYVSAAELDPHFFTN